MADFREKLGQIEFLYKNWEKIRISDENGSMLTATLRFRRRIVAKPVNFKTNWGSE